MLLGFIVAADPSLAASLTEVVALNPYGVDIRYPGDVLESTGEDAEEAIQLADKVKEVVLLALKVQT